MTKIPCDDCGALILPATAERTGGICMACKQGIRKSMDASRAYYENLKIYDPFRELWRSLVKRSSIDTQLEHFSSDERVYFCACLLEGEVYNGGFDQFFSNSSGNYYQISVDALREIGALRSLDIVVEAAEIIFGEREPSSDRMERCKIMSSRTRRLSEVLKRYRQTSRLEHLDKQFYDDPDQLGERLRNYATQRGLVNQFLDEPRFI